METDEGMRREMYQRFLDQEALRGSSELEAWRALGVILGISFPAKEKQPEKQTQ